MSKGPCTGRIVHIPTCEAAATWVFKCKMCIYSLLVVWMNTFHTHPLVCLVWADIPYEQIHATHIFHMYPTNSNRQTSLSGRDFHVVIITYREHFWTLRIYYYNCRVGERKTMSPRPSQLNSNERLLVSNSEGGCGYLFMAVQKHKKQRDIYATVCVYVCVWVCASTCVTDILVSSVSMGHRG